MSAPRVLVIGGISSDIIVSIKEMPRANEKIFADNKISLPNGEGINTAVAISRLGSDCLICSKIGDDAVAKELVEYLKFEKVDTRFISRAAGEDTASVITIRCDMLPPRKIICPGAQAKLSTVDVEEAFISYPDGVVLLSDCPSSVFKTVSSLSVINNAPLFVMSAQDSKTLSEYSGCRCEVLSVNEEETVKITGINPSNQEKCMKACISLSQTVNSKFIILRLGDRGYFIFDGTYYSFISAYDIPNPKQISSDFAFSSALVLEYLRSGGDIKHSCEFAAISAAVYISKGGGLLSYPLDKDIRDFVEQNQIDFKYQTDLNV